MSKSSAFQNKPIPWMYSTLGSMLAIALMKLVPIHRRLTELEIKNIQDYFNSDFVSPKRRKQINRLLAFFMTYLNAIRRITKISRHARQDYYALNRRGAFAVMELPQQEHPNSPYLPLVIVPGLNTPPVFFREIHSYFARQGYNVSVVKLPHEGLSDVKGSAVALKQEIETLKQRHGVQQVDIVGHCLGGIIAQYFLENLEAEQQTPSIRNLISLGTGFQGAEGVQQLKELWIPRNPGKPIPKVFDELIQWNLNIARRSKDVAYHSLLTVWDFMVHFRKGLLENPDGGMVSNHIIEDPAIDHLTIVLNHQVFQRIEAILNTPQRIKPYSLCKQG